MLLLGELVSQVDGLLPLDWLTGSGKTGLCSKQLVGDHPEY